MTKEYSKCFLRKHRINGSKFLYVDERESELREFMDMIHSAEFYNCPPNDWIYEVAFWAFHGLEVYSLKDIRIELDDHEYGITSWLNDNIEYSIKFCDEILSLGFNEKNILTIISEAKRLAKQRIYGLVNDFINDQKRKTEGK